MRGRVDDISKKEESEEVDDVGDVGKRFGEAEFDWGSGVKGLEGSLGVWVERLLGESTLRAVRSGLSL